VEGRSTDPVGEGAPFVSVVIPVFDHAERLPACLAAIERQRYPPECYEVVLVDNGSREDLHAAAAGFPRVRIVEEAETGSYAARNRGLANARGNVLAFTDADCVPEPDWLAHGVRALLAAPGIGLVAGRIDLVFGDPRSPTAAELYESVASFRQRDYVERWGFGATANLFAFRHSFERAGPFDARLRSLGDREWGQRVCSTGLRPAYAHDAAVNHPARKTLAQLLRRTARMTGGFHALARTQGWTRRSFLREAATSTGWMAVLLVIPAGRDMPAGLRSLPRRGVVAVTLLLVIVVRVLELLRLVAGGGPRRA
jgi:GT2 family glycosyltransferase